MASLVLLPWNWMAAVNSPGYKSQKSNMGKFQKKPRLLGTVRLDRAVPDEAYPVWSCRPANCIPDIFCDHAVVKDDNEFKRNLYAPQLLSVMLFNVIHVFS